ncbi:MAG: glycosyltransferase family A protein [Patescibacteria group bacterium]
MNPLISVIIPVYNHAHTIKKCISDILAQTYQPIEIIIVNDGSTDNFQQAISDLKNSDIKIFSQENKGAPSARNLGFAQSKGEYVIFWDADTIARPDMLEKMYKALRDNSETSCAYSKFKFGWKTMQSHEFDPGLLKKLNYIDVTSLVRRSALTDLRPSAGPWDESIKRFQDWDLWLSLLEKNKTGVFVPEVLYKKVVGNRKGISAWLPSFMYNLPWKIKKVADYEEAKAIVLKKHGLQ